MTKNTTTLKKLSKPIKKDTQKPVKLVKVRKSTLNKQKEYILSLEKRVRDLEKEIETKKQLEERVLRLEKLLNEKLRSKDSLEEMFDVIYDSNRNEPGKIKHKKYTIKQLERAFEKYNEKVQTETIKAYEKYKNMSPELKNIPTWEERNAWLRNRGIVDPFRELPHGYKNSTPERIEGLIKGLKLTSHKQYSKKMAESFKKGLERLLPDDTFSHMISDKMVEMNSDHRHEFFIKYAHLIRAYWYIYHNDTFESDRAYELMRQLAVAMVDMRILPASILTEYNLIDVSVPKEGDVIWTSRMYAH